jgi:hypothetical protein
MSLRLEFDTEWFNDAEQSIATMAFQEDDTEAIRGEMNSFLMKHRFLERERERERSFTDEYQS